MGPSHGWVLLKIPADSQKDVCGSTEPGRHHVCSKKNEKFCARAFAVFAFQANLTAAIADADNHDWQICRQCDFD
jgi:hypothetical protein